MPIRRGLEELRKFMPLSTTAEAEKAFTTYKNYLVHIDSCLGGVYGVGDDLITGLIQEVRSTKRFGSIQGQRIRGKEREATAKALPISWAKELQLRIPAAFDAQLPAPPDRGGPTPLYYAVFHGARALFLSSGQQVDPTHASALAVLSTWVRDRKPHEGQTPHPRADRPDDTRDDEATDS